MIRINLLPYRAARKSEDIRRQVSLFLLSLGLSFTVFALVFLIMAGNIRGLKNNISVTEKELESYKPQAEEVDMIIAELESLAKKTAVIDKLEKNRRAPLILFDKVNNTVVPERMWFTGFKVKDKSVEIKGIALDNKTAADFMKELEKSGLFSNVKLKEVKHIIEENRSLMEFNIVNTLI